MSKLSWQLLHNFKQQEAWYGRLIVCSTTLPPLQLLADDQLKLLSTAECLVDSTPWNRVDIANCDKASTIAWLQRACAC